jgi:NodT family efflux transporter outer membrane factor (OMF) lipoprotein
MKYTLPIPARVAAGVTCSLIALAGCKTVGPEYQAPAPAAPDAWQTAAAKDLARSGEPLQTWWKVFKDPALDALIADVRTNNFNLAAAAARLDEAAARYGVALGALAPAVSGAGEVARKRGSERMRTLDSQLNNPYMSYSAGFDMSWEIDLWGRVKRSVEAAHGRWEASVEDSRDLLVVLQASAATTYIQFRTLQQRLAFLRENAVLQEGTLKLTQDRRKAELTGELDVRQAELNLATTRALIPQLEAQRDQALNGLCALCGRLPGSLNQLLAQTSGVPVVAALPALLPADLLRQRPDVRAAERRLAAQTAKVGMAEGDLYPLFSLNGSFAWQSSESGHLFDPQARAYGFGPSFSWALLDGQRVRNSIRAEEALAREALANYEQAVRDALRESEDALAAFAGELRRLESLRAAVTAAQQSAKLADTLYRTGLTDFQNVLDMQRALLQQQDAQAASEGVASQNLIAIYRAFGGGWPEPAAPPAPKVEPGTPEPPRAPAR